jgi:hypothetical protein
MRYPRRLHRQRSALLYSVIVLTATLCATASHAASGDLDPTFGTGGYVTLALGTHSYANAVAIQDDGKIVAAGYLLNAAPGGMVAVRVDSAGALDATFGTGGVVSLPAGSQALAQAVAIQPADDKIVVGGGHDEVVDGLSSRVWDVTR